MVIIDYEFVRLSELVGGGEGAGWGDLEKLL